MRKSPTNEIKAQVSHLQHKIDQLRESITISNYEEVYRQLAPLTVKIKAVQGKSLGYA